MSLGYDVVQSLQNEAPAQAWASIFGRAWDICCQPIDDGKADAEVARRDRSVRSCRRGQVRVAAPRGAAARLSPILMPRLKAVARMATRTVEKPTTARG